MSNELSKNEQVAAILTAGIMAKMAHTTDVTTAAIQAVKMYRAVVKQLQQPEQQT